MLVDNIAPAIKPYLNKPFALFGHSMGALISFELARRLRREEAPGPVQLFVSGCRAPQLPERDVLTYQLGESEFLERLKELNGTPDEVLNHPELMKLMLPLLRADFEAVGTYTYSNEPPLSCPISSYGGLRDAETSREDLDAWRTQTVSHFTLRMFEGGHFFIQEAERSLLATLARELAG